MCPHPHTHSSHRFPPKLPATLPPLPWQNHAYPWATWWHWAPASLHRKSHKFQHHCLVQQQREWVLSTPRNTPGGCHGSPAFALGPMGPSPASPLSPQPDLLLQHGHDDRRKHQDGHRQDHTCQCCLQQGLRMGTGWVRGRFRAGNSH